MLECDVRVRIVRTMLHVVICLSVCLFVTRQYCVETAKISSNFFSPSGSMHTILVFFSYEILRQYSDGDFITEASNAGEVWKNRDFLTNVSLCLGNDTRYGHSYYGTPVCDLIVECRGVFRGAEPPPPKLGKHLHESLKFCQLTLGKIIKIVATRCQILKLKCTKFNFGWGGAPDHAGGAYSAPQTP